MEIHGEFFKGLFGGFKTPFKLCFLCFSLWGITEKLTCEICDYFSLINLPSYVLKISNRWI
jgi:hypothetical protein